MRSKRCAVQNQGITLMNYGYLYIYTNVIYVVCMCRSIKISACTLYSLSTEDNYSVNINVHVEP